MQVFKTNAEKMILENMYFIVRNHQYFINNKKAG